MTEELSKIVAAAEETTAQILQRARTSTREQILEADRLWREVQSEALRFASWRQEAEAVVGVLQTMIEEARTRIESVPERIQDALGPAVEAMIRMDDGISRFAAAAQLPLLLAPSGLASARSSVEAAGAAEQPAPVEAQVDAAPEAPAPEAPAPAAEPEPASSPFEIGYGTGFEDLIPADPSGPEPTPAWEPAPSAENAEGGGFDPILALSHLPSFEQTGREHEPEEPEESEEGDGYSGVAGA